MVREMLREELAWMDEAAREILGDVARVPATTSSD